MIISNTTPLFAFAALGRFDLLKGASRVLIDERLGRNFAEYHGLAVVGSLGTLLKARQHGLIPAFLPLVRQLQASGFRYHEPLVMRLAALVGES